MKYIYKHGNQYWYQRAVPEKLSNLLGKKTIKISLKTNKISTAIKRAKLQALQHIKMFNDLDNDSKKYIKKIFGKSSFSSNKYTLSFNEDYEDLINKLLFSKSDLINFLKDRSLNDYKNQSLEKILLEENFNNFPNLDMIIDQYLQQKHIFNDPKKIYSINKSVSILIEICGNKAIDSYNVRDAENFRNHFIKSKKISTGKRNQSNIQNIFSTIYNKYSIDRKNPFSGLKWPNYQKSIIREGFSIQELNKIKKFCLNDKSFISLICGIMFDTGCSCSEIVGLSNEDVNLNKYNPYLVIRSNSFREIKNIYKRRVIPLVGVSLESICKIKKCNNKEFLFKNYFNCERLKMIQLEKKVNDRLRLLSKEKTSISFRYSIIDRLKSINCPESIISDLIGMAKKESFYRNDITLDIKSSWLEQIVI